MLSVSQRVSCRFTSQHGSQNFVDAQNLAACIFLHKHYRFQSVHRQLALQIVRDAAHGYALGFLFLTQGIKAVFMLVDIVGRVHTGEHFSVFLNLKHKIPP